MMRCPACGKDVKAGVKFCTGCGKPLPAVQTGAEARVGVGARAGVGTRAGGMRAAARAASQSAAGPAVPTHETRPSQESRRMGSVGYQSPSDPWSTGAKEREAPPAYRPHSQQAPPPPEPKKERVSSLLNTHERQRGFWFTMLLVLITFGSPLGAYYFAAYGQEFLNAIRQMDAGLNIPSWYIVFSIASMALIFVAAIGMWMWKRWGALLYFLNGIVNIAVTLMLTRQVGSLIGSTVGLLIVYAIVMPHWNEMD